MNDLFCVTVGNSSNNLFKICNSLFFIEILMRLFRNMMKQLLPVNKLH